MKKIIGLALLAIGTHCSSYAQFVIDTSFRAGVGSKIQEGDWNFDNFNPGPSGGNQTWNFSSMTFTGYRPFYAEGVLPNETPVFLKFPKANFAVRREITSSNIQYRYHRDSVNGRYYLGGDYAPFFDSASEGDPREPYPIVYQQLKVVKHSLQRFQTPDHSYPITFVTEVDSILADGFGTLILGGTTYNDVMRVYTIAYMVDSIVLPGGNPPLIARTREERWTWIDRTTKQHVLNLFYTSMYWDNDPNNINTSSLASGSRDISQPTGIAERLRNIKLFPNPAKGNTFITTQHTEQLPEKVILLGLDGRQFSAAVEAIDAYTYKVDLSFVVPGIYMLLLPGFQPERITVLMN